MTETVGLPLNETTLGTQLKKAGYATVSAAGPARSDVAGTAAAVVPH